VKTLLLALAALAGTAQAQSKLRYAVDLSDTVHHVFAVTLRVPALTDSNAVFEFAATAPGTYQTMNVGRFVHDFTALDARGSPVQTERLSTNEWRFAEPRRVRVITYHIIATRDDSPRCASDPCNAQRHGRPGAHLRRVGQRPDHGDTGPGGYATNAPCRRRVSGETARRTLHVSV
jgi:hypothetical protein